MEEDDDDFYGGGGASGEYDSEDISPPNYGVKAEQMDVSDEEGEEEDSDDDVQFTLEKPPDTAQTEPPTTGRVTRSQTAASQERATSLEAKPAKESTPIKQEQRTGSTVPQATIKGTLTHNGKEGGGFPEIRTSTIDLDAIPIWPANGKPIIEVDMDADLAESTRLWRLPGTDQTDFFNYGFDEYTWAQYCLRQQTMSNTISEQKQADAQMKAMFGGGGDGGGNGSNGMPSMPGMPSPEDFMQMMASSGANPNDPNAFMQMMSSMGMPGMQGGSGQQNQQGGGGFGGPNQSNSPHPQAGQGFQPPQGDQGAFGANMDGYSAQQMAIMQQQQQGGGGRGRGVRRGRGYH